MSQGTWGGGVPKDVEVEGLEDATTNRHEKQREGLELPVPAWGHSNSEHVRYWIYIASARHQPDHGWMHPSWMLIRRMYCGQSSCGTNCSDVMFVEQLSQVPSAADPATA